MNTNSSDTNALAIKLIASVRNVRQWIGWLKNESATDHRPKPFASAFQAWNFQTASSPCGAAPPMPRQQIARPSNSRDPNRSFRRHCARWPSVNRLTLITVAVSRQYKNTARGKLMCTSLEDRRR